jgi:HEAT repeat protein
MRSTIRKFTSSLSILSVIFTLSCGKSIKPFSDAEKIKSEITAAVHQYSSDNWEERERAVVRMHRYGDSAFAANVTLFFIKATEDRQPLVRIKAVQGLRIKKDPAALARLRVMAREEPRSNVRWHTLLALGDYGLAENEPFFIEGFKSRDWIIREASVIGILSIIDMETQKRNIPLIKNAINDNILSVRLAALNHLKFKDELLYTEIAGIINNRKSSRSLLKAALGAIKGYRLDLKTRERLISLLTHYDRDIRVSAFRVLREEPVQM